MMPQDLYRDYHNINTSAAKTQPPSPDSHRSSHPKAMFLQRFANQSARSGEFPSWVQHSKKLSRNQKVRAAETVVRTHDANALAQRHLRIHGGSNFHSENAHIRELEEALVEIEGEIRELKPELILCK